MVAPFAALQPNLQAQPVYSSAPAKTDLLQDVSGVAAGCCRDSRGKGSGGKGGQLSHEAVQRQRQAYACSGGQQCSSSSSNNHQPHIAPLPACLC